MIEHVKRGFAALVAFAIFSNVTGLARPVGKLVPSVTRSRLLSSGDIRQGSPTSKEPHVELDMFDLHDLNMRSVEVMLHEDGPSTVFDRMFYDKESWYGEKREGEGFLHLALPSGSSHLTGMIQDRGGSYGLWTRRDGTIFATTEEKYYSAENAKDPKSSGKTMKGGGAKLPSNGRGLQGKGGKGKGGKGGKGGTGNKKTRVDIMVLYSRQAMCAHAGQPIGCTDSKANREAIEAEAKLNVAITNVAFIQSGINVELKLVHLDLDDFYNEVVDDTDDCAYREIIQDDDEGNNCNAAATPSLIGTRTDVHQLRDNHGADIVAYIIDKNYNDYGGGNGISGDAWGSDATEAYILVNRNSRFHFVFTHELGHIFGVPHDNSYCNMRTNGATDNTFQGPCFKTIMVSRGESRCECFNPTAAGGNDFTDPNTGIQDRVSRTMIVPRIPLFASPNVEYSGHNLHANLCTTGGGTSQCPAPWNCFSCPTGRSAAEIIESNAPTVANFRSNPLQPIPLVFGMGLAAALVSVAVYTRKRRNVRVISIGDGVTPYIRNHDVDPAKAVVI